MVSHNSKFVREEASPLAVRPGEMGTEGEREKKKEEGKKEKEKILKSQFRGTVIQVADKTEGWWRWDEKSHPRRRKPPFT